MTTQDAREMRANHFSNYLYKNLALKYKFVDDFKNMSDPWRGNWMC